MIIFILIIFIDYYCFITIVLLLLEYILKNYKIFLNFYNIFLNYYLPNKVVLDRT